jgi:hypothetical protein
MPLKKGTHAATWFYSQSFHDLPAPTERRPPQPLRKAPVPGCLRGLDDTQCAARCCACCDDGERLTGEELCAGCLTDLETERRIDEDLDAQARRAARLDDRTPTDLTYDAWKARER